jgi:hypothetical protein
MFTAVGEIAKCLKRAQSRHSLHLHRPPQNHRLLNARQGPVCGLCRRSLQARKSNEDQIGINRKGGELPFAAPAI